jgi:hypothetical protein
MDSVWEIGLDPSESECDKIAASYENHNDFDVPLKNQMENYQLKERTSLQRVNLPWHIDFLRQWGINQVWLKALTIN